MLNTQPASLLLLLTVFTISLRVRCAQVHSLTSFDPNAPHRDPPGSAGEARARRTGAVGALGQPPAAGDPGEPRARTEAESRASWLEHFDTLTGLANRTDAAGQHHHAMAAPGRIRNWRS
jgi:hypothetical protein